MENELTTPEALLLWSRRCACARICALVVSWLLSAAVLSVASGTEFQSRNESRAATSSLLSAMPAPDGDVAVVWLSSGRMMNDGATRNAFRID